MTNPAHVFPVRLSLPVLIASQQGCSRMARFALAFKPVTCSGIFIEIGQWLRFSACGAWFFSPCFGIAEPVSHIFSVGVPSKVFNAIVGRIRIWAVTSLQPLRPWAYERGKNEVVHGAGNDLASGVKGDFDIALPVSARLHLPGLADPTRATVVTALAARGPYRAIGSCEIVIASRYRFEFGLHDSILPKPTIGWQLC